jgi:hypothetical protein
MNRRRHGHRLVRAMVGNIIATAEHAVDGEYTYDELVEIWEALSFAAKRVSQRIEDESRRGAA